MAHSKKSRKPKEAPIAKPKLSKQALAEAAKHKKPKKKTGKPAGNRQQEAVKKKKGTSSNPRSNDPRVGNKTPIVLGTLKQEAPQSIKKEKPTPIAAVRPIEVEEKSLSLDALEQELYTIEDDPRLAAILNKQDEDVELSEEEVLLFNELMDRHQAIREQLGWDDEEDDVEEENSNVSDDDLWNKFDNDEFDQD